MIYVDHRIGSGELAGYLSMLGPEGDVVVPPYDIAFGDFYWLGNGPGGLPIPCGVERKALDDFIASYRTGRLFSHQLPGLLNSYHEVWIIVEGVWSCGQDGMLQVRKGKEWVDFDKGGKLLYSTLEKMVLTAELKAVETATGSGGRVHFRRTTSKTDTCRIIRAQYEWWTHKEWEEHRSHLKFSVGDTGAVQLTKLDPTNPQHLVRLMAKELKGIGWDKAIHVSNTFPTVRDMAGATSKQWQGIPGIGKTLAQRIRAAIGWTKEEG